MRMPIKVGVCTYMQCMSFVEPWLKSSLSNRFQQKVLNGQCSSWSSVLVNISCESLKNSLVGVLC